MGVRGFIRLRRAAEDNLQATAAQAVAIRDM